MTVFTELKDVTPNDYTINGTRLKFAFIDSGLTWMSLGFRILMFFNLSLYNSLVMSFQARWNRNGG